MTDPAVPEAIAVVLTNVPDAQTGERIARALVTERLVACANVLAPCASIYRWQGAIEESTEVPVLFKTRAGLLEALSRRIAELHPYEVPEILAWHPERVAPAYARWVCGETAPDEGFDA